MNLVTKSWWLQLCFSFGLSLNDTFGINNSLLTFLYFGLSGVDDFVHVGHKRTRFCDLILSVTHFSDSEALDIVRSMLKLPSIALVTVLPDFCQYRPGM